MKNFIEETMLIIALIFMCLHIYGKICEEKGFSYLDPFLFIFPIALLGVLLFIVSIKK